MATTRRLVELFRSIASDDFTSAKGVAAQICRTEEQLGHRSAARQLRGALGVNGHNANGRHSELLASGRITIASEALVRLPTDVSIDDVVLPSRSRQELSEVVLEWRHRVRLQEKAIPPRSRLLFHGPPGCGKSVTARALAKELDLPAYLVRFDAVIGAYLGQTAIHLRQLFHFAEVTPCVLLLDELDALGKRRGNPLDVGELDRIVISLMQELEHSKPAGLIIATSNLAQHLDRALWRRFDLAMKFPAPASATLRRFSERIAKARKVTVPAKVLRRAATARGVLRMLKAKLLERLAARSFGNRKGQLMPRDQRPTPPRTFFLNESHELTPDEKGGGGGLPKFSGINWDTKGRHISGSLTATSRHIAASGDPLKEKRFFLLAQPVDKVEKRRETKQGMLKELYEEVPEYGGVQGKIFDRLGLDLIEVTNDGKALVHGEKERVEHLASRTASLGKLGPLEQSRWASIASFEVIPLHLRVDADWLKTLRPDSPVDIVFELQPVLTRVEADRMLRAISDLLTQSGSERLTGTGTDFSGRHWFRGKASQKSVRTIAKDFYSVQSIHPPLYSLAASKSRPRPDSKVTVSPTTRPDAASLPCVAIVDLGIPRDHKQIGPYRRGQFYPQDAPASPVGDHGSFVASRVIFGDHDSDEELLAASGKCSVYDAMVGDYPAGVAANRVNDKIVMPAMQGVRGAAPDVRVFNLSFGDTRHLLDFPEIERREKRLALQDLDNFIFATDSIVVVAAGNSARGVTPNPAYPDHHADPRWALGPWACGFNTLVCGAYVSRLSATGMVQKVGWPSPFTRIGPGLCDAPIPSFCAPGGNTGETYNFTPGMGVWGFSGSGLVEDRPGTSNAAPILAREAALMLDDLQQFCPGGTNPFGILIKAFLALTASAPTDDANVLNLVERTLGYGLASRTRLLAPSTGSAVMLWQGYVESPKDIVRVQIPIPQEWMTRAEDPVLRLVVCSDPPVNEASHANWACRKIHAVLHPGPDTPGIRAQRGGHPSFPLMDRVYRLQKFKPDGETPANTDIWLLEVSYEEISPYTPGGDFDPRQRVAFAAELVDKAEDPVDPQSSLQKLPIAATMTRLSIEPAPIRTPIIVRTR